VITRNSGVSNTGRNIVTTSSIPCISTPHRIVSNRQAYYPPLTSHSWGRIHIPFTSHRLLCFSVLWLLSAMAAGDR
jgi:hypothetical protein